jgi:hypothetical protein
VLGTAKADAFGAELAGDLGVAGNVGIRAHAELAAQLVCPAHKGGQHAGGGVGVHGGRTAGIDLAGGPSSDSQSPSFSVYFLPPKVAVITLACSSIRDRFGAGHAGRAHTAGDHGRVAGHTAARRQNALGRFHAVNVVRHGFLTNQQHGSLRRLRHRIVRVNTILPTAAPGDAGRPLPSPVNSFSDRIQHRVQQLIQLVRIDAHDGFFSGNQAFFHHLNGDANSGRAGALAVAGLQHPQLLILDGELEILDVAVVLFERGSDLTQLLVGFRQHIAQFDDRARRTDAGHDVFALCVGQELAVECVLDRWRGCA